MLNRKLPDEVVQRAPQVVHDFTNQHAKSQGQKRCHGVQVQAQLEYADVGHDATLHGTCWSDQFTLRQAAMLQPIFGDDSFLDTFVVTLTPVGIRLRVVGLEKRPELFVESTDLLVRPVNLGVCAIEGSVHGC